MSGTPLIRTDFPRLPASLIDRLRAFPASVFADVAGRRGTMHGGIQAATRHTKFAGSALTVEVRPGDNLMIHAAIAIAKPGDVIVVDGKGDRTCALMGAIMMNACKRIGVAGVVLDGSHRDTDELDQLGVPMFSAGANPNGPTKNIAGRLNWPISCGGVAVNPGDLVMADADGVVVIEPPRINDLIPLAEKKLAEEQKRVHEITHDGPIVPKWLDEALRAAGVLRKDETL